jgi:dephospho-CoA kinase
MLTPELPRIVGLCGKKQSGKDTVGDYLCEEYGYKKIAMANALKMGCKNIFGLTEEQINGDLKEVDDDFWKVTPRQILQFVGTDLLRNKLVSLIPHIKQDIWIEVVRKQILNEWKQHPKTKFVITDIRFQNEIHFIQELNGIVIRLSRNIQNTDLHVSENEVDKFIVDSDILNDSTVEDLHNRVQRIFS